MKKLRVLLCSMLASSIVMLAATGAGAANSDFGDWYVHATGMCAPGSVTMYLDRSLPTSADLDGCGLFGYNAAALPLVGSLVGRPFDFNWPGSQALTAGIDAGTAIAGTIFVTSEEPTPVSAAITLSGFDPTTSQSVIVGTASTNTASTLNAATGTGWVALNFALTTSAPVSTVDRLDLDAKISATVDVFIGYAGSHASSFVVGAQSNSL